jgi:hypothetical protein
MGGQPERAAAVVMTRVCRMPVMVGVRGTGLIDRHSEFLDLMVTKYCDRRAPRIERFMALAWKLLTLIAVLLMPFGMTAADAAPAQHHSASMPMRHCPEQAPKHDSKAGFVECTMVCSAALPAGDLKRDGPHLIVCAPTEAAAVRQLHGLHPETATPPPRRS